MATRKTRTRLYSAANDNSALARVSGYAQRVIDGVETAGPHIRAACRRHFADLVRGIYLPFSGRSTEWSAWIAVKTPNVWIQDIYPIDLDRLAEDVKAWQSYMGNGLRDALEELRAVSAWAANQELSNFSDKQELRREVASTTEQTTAYFRETIIAATGPGSAISLKVDELQAQVFDPDTGLPAVANAVSLLETQVDIIDGKVSTNASAIIALQASYDEVSGSATFRMETGYTPSAGWSSKIGLQTRINDGAVFRDAGLFIESTATQARVIISADQFIVTAPGYEKQPFVFIGGVAALQVANIGTVTAGVLQSPDGKVKFDLANKRLTFSD
ncbi:hypothetical protein [Mesorhizobium sp. 8]|uniref:hypothetical protein n=1 Tax=Mesorhizobium sp. 8 TaxID=2584466 RepID=UPI0011232120|nr:hypothetical protein [Mesorhizobium sp. 8]QDC00345.1 hypothetical protein FGU64_07910 [Mesorhizobium sp. 8]